MRSLGGRLDAKSIVLTLSNGNDPFRCQTPEKARELGFKTAESSATNGNAILCDDA